MVLRMNTFALPTKCLTGGDGYVLLKGAPAMKQTEGVSSVELGKGTRA